MVYIMQRYQIYLDPYHVATIDEYGAIAQLNRSEVLRFLIERTATQATKVLALLVPPKKSASLDSIIGLIDLGTTKKSNFALRDNKFYLSKTT